MIVKIGSSKPIFWFIFHLVIGFLSTQSKLPLTFWVLFISLNTFINLINFKNKNGEIHLFLGYLVTLEILSRMVYLTPIVPIEVGKYLSFVFLIFGITIDAPKINGKPYYSKAGILIVILALPSLLLMKFDSTFRELFVFNALGIINLGLFVIYFRKREIGLIGIINILRLICYPLISMVVYLTIKTSNFADITFNLSSNFETSGGFGSNQVASILGIGIFALVFSFIINVEIFKSRVIDLGLLLLFFFRALLTFSRGGVSTILFAILPLISINPFIFVIKNIAKRTNNLIKIIALFIGMMVFFLFTNSITNNFLLLRYQGKTNAIQLGDKDMDLNTLSSGRFKIIEHELDLYFSNLIFGVGPGNAKVYDDNSFERISAHTEFTRLLAEHGLFGLIINVILFIYVLFSLRVRNSSFEKRIAFSFFILALLTASHAAMRTLITPFFYGLACAHFNLNEIKVDRKNK